MGKASTKPFVKKLDEEDMACVLRIREAAMDSDGWKCTNEHIGKQKTVRIERKGSEN